MKIYESRKDTAIKAKLIEYNAKFNTYMVEFITGDRKGKTTSFSASTMKRWWKEIKDYDVDNNIDTELPKPAYDILDNIESMLKNFNVEIKRSTRYISIYSKGERLATIYKRIRRVRIYMKTKAFNILDIEDYINRPNININDIDFYVEEFNIDTVIKAICEGGK